MIQEDIHSQSNSFTLKKGDKIKILESEQLSSFIPGFYICNSIKTIYYSHSDFEISLNSEIEIVDPIEFEERILSGSIDYKKEIGAWLGEEDFEIWNRLSSSLGVFKYF